MSDVTNGIGGTVSVTATAQQVLLTPAIGSAGGHKTANTLKVWNTGSSTIYATVNMDAETGEPETSGVPIPAGESFWFVGQPMRNLNLECTSDETSTAMYGAY